MAVIFLLMVLIVVPRKMIDFVKFNIDISSKIAIWTYYVLFASTNILFVWTWLKDPGFVKPLED